MCSVGGLVHIRVLLLDSLTTAECRCLYRVAACALGDNAPGACSMASKEGMQKPPKETQKQSFSAGCRQSLRNDLPRTAGVAPSLVLIACATMQRACRTSITRILHCATAVTAVVYILIGSETDRECQNSPAQL